MAQAIGTDGAGGSGSHYYPAKFSTRQEAYDAQSKYSLKQQTLNGSLDGCTYLLSNYSSDLEKLSEIEGLLLVISSNLSSASGTVGSVTTAFTDEGAFFNGNSDGYASQSVTIGEGLETCIEDVDTGVSEALRTAIEGYNNNVKVVTAIQSWCQADFDALQTAFYIIEEDLLPGGYYDQLEGKNS